MSSLSRLGPDLRILFKDHAVLTLSALEKQARPSHVRGYLRVHRFSEDPSLCPVAALTTYCDQISRLNPSRAALFASFCAPYDVVTPQTLARWTVALLTAAGVDTSVWKSHSARSASALHHRRHLSVLQIHRLADWSSSSGVFKTFYERFL